MTTCHHVSMHACVHVITFACLHFRKGECWNRGFALICFCSLLSLSCFLLNAGQKVMPTDIHSTASSSGLEVADALASASLCSTVRFTGSVQHFNGLCWVFTRYCVLMSFAYIARSSDDVFYGINKKLLRYKMNRKVTGPKAASNASKTLTSGSTAAKSKTAAASALSQTKAPKKDTSASAASAASKTLRDGRCNKASKSAAGSALSQRAGKKK